MANLEIKKAIPFFNPSREVTGEQIWASLLPEPHPPNAFELFVQKYCPGKVNKVTFLLDEKTHSALIEDLSEGCEVVYVISLDNEEYQGLSRSLQGRVKRYMDTDE